SALVALPDLGTRVLSASETRRVRPRRANGARRPLLGARQRLDAAQELRMLNEEAQLQQVEHLLDSLEPRQRMPPDYFSELVAQIPEIVSNVFGIHGIVKELD